MVVAAHLAAAEARPGNSARAAGGASRRRDQARRMEAMAKAAVDRHGGVDVLCANAGMFPQVTIENMTAEQWDEVSAPTSRALPRGEGLQYRISGRPEQGRIVITSSITGPVTGFPGWTPLWRHQGGPARLHAHRLHGTGEIRHHRQRRHARQYRDRRPAGTGRGLHEGHGRGDSLGISATSRTSAMPRCSSPRTKPATSPARPSSSTAARSCRNRPTRSRRCSERRATTLPFASQDRRRSRHARGTALTEGKAG